eukprot:TRINITY_DN19354_c0_g1_i3.p1 TRINITY_DN19354_c0_g1~~TRINITY_DN19354_c0_g1_i3.p1  ORF type:complete len:114 (+),score=27.94 TRINITY_DN19354_c0_g1_i3:21-362(+)
MLWLAIYLFYTQVSHDFSTFFFFLMIRRPPRSTLSSSSAASDVYKRQYQRRVRGEDTIIANLDATAHQAVAQRFGVRGFPTLKFFTKGNKDGLAYQGGRDAASLSSYVEKNAQ